MIGYGGIEMVGADDLGEAQFGYSVADDGTDLTGTNDGDWMRQWVVIGEEVMCGDPVFVDTEKPGFPVYTAMHGEGSWDPTLISETYLGFVSILDRLALLAKGREHPAGLIKKPLTLEEIEAFVAFASKAGRLEDPGFWESLLDYEIE